MNDPYAIIQVDPESMLQQEEMGSKEKFWCQPFLKTTDATQATDTAWLFKYPQPNTGQHWAEKIASEVAEVLGICHATVELAEFAGNKGSIAESFVPDGGALYHGNQVLQNAIVQYDPKQRFKQSTHTMHNILAALSGAFTDTDGAMSAKASMAEYMILDAVIGNTDRHHENWGVLRTGIGADRTECIAPSFDHASSLGRELLDKRRDRAIAQNRVSAYAERARGAIYWTEQDTHGVSPLDLVRRGTDSHPELFGPALSKLDNLDSDVLNCLVNRIPSILDVLHSTGFRSHFGMLQSPGTQKARIMTTRTLFLAWQDTAQSRQWFPVGRLDVEMDAADPRYRFRYIGGARRAQDEAGFPPLIEFPKLEEEYLSNELFPVFRNRVIAKGRSDRSDYLRALDLGPDADPIEILSVNGGSRVTDTYEVFPKLVRHEDGSFVCRFFLHGWRHVNARAQSRIDELENGDSLYMSLELTNPVTRIAIQIQTTDYHMIGWAPRYLMADLEAAVAESPHYSVSVVRIKPLPAPSMQRVLIEMRGCWTRHRPMESEDYQPLA